MHIKSFFNEDEEDITLLNVQYIPVRKTDTGFSDDVLYLIYRDNKTKEKKVKTIFKPKTETFITKPEYRMSFKTQRGHLPEHMAESKIFRYSSMASSIIKELENSNIDQEYIPICKQEKKEIFKWRHSYFADYDIRDYSMISYINNKNTKINTELSKAYLDIESDIFGRTSSEIDDCECPINAVSVVMTHDEHFNELKHPKVYTLLLRNHFRYKEQEYFENHLDKFIEECHEEFDKDYNKPDFVIRVYDDEVILLRTLFGLLHKKSPDFILIWNMGYDIPTIMKRLEKLGENPINYFCHKDFEIPNLRYNYDLKFRNVFKNKSESVDCTSYSQWADQMLNYAGIRKSKADYGGNNLDNIAKIELGSEKRKYSKANVNVINGAIEEYWNFVKYSINDVLLQYGIDKKTSDTETLFEQSLYGGTRFSKALKQSVYLKNVWAIEYFIRDIIPKNNNNINYSKFEDEEASVDSQIISEDYDNLRLNGALVGDPTLNDYTGVTILGKKSNALFKYTVDFDFKALYPYIKITNNISAESQHARLIIKNKIFEDENPDNTENFIRAGKFIEDLETDDGSLTARWINVPLTYDVLKDYKKYREKGRIK